MQQNPFLSDQPRVQVGICHSIIRLHIHPRAIIGDRRRRRAVEAEEAHAGCLQGDEREPVHIGEAAQPIRIAAPADPSRRAFLFSGRAFLFRRIGGGGTGHAPATHRG